MEQNSKTRTFEPLFIADCKAPTQELMRIAKERQIPHELLEINLKEVFYFLKTKENPSFEELLEEHMHLIEDDAFLLREDVEIMQHFAIIIAPKKKHPFHFSLRLSSDARELFFTLHKTSQILDTPSFLEELFHRIRAQKASMGILFRHEEDERKKIAQMIQELHALKSFDEDCEILLTKGLGGRCIEAKLELNFKANHASNEKYPAVKEGALLATFIKPKRGEAGRDCMGKFIPQQDPTPLENPLHTGTGVKIDEGEESTKYSASENGYIIYDNHNLQVVQKLEISNVGVNTTGSLISDLDAPTSIHVTENHTLKEALGDGAKIEASEVEIDGNIGNASEIHAHKVTIKGQTHQNSKVFASVAGIEIHKGYFLGDEVSITRLEAGIVYAQKVNIAHAYGGKIYADEIFIENLYSNLHAHASSKIEIAHLVGEDNKFTLSPLANPKQASIIEGIFDEISEIDELLKHKLNLLNKEIPEIKTLKKSADQIQALIKTHKKNGEEIPTYLREKWTSYFHILKKIQLQKEEITTLQNTQEELKKRLSSLQESTLHAYIHAKDGWKGYNEVRYKLLSPKKEVFLAPKNGYHYGMLILDKTQESIISTKENP